MKRTLVIALGTPAVAALFLLAGGSPAANAGEQHHPQQHCVVAPKCRPAPLPKPPGGWPCAKTHSCGLKHHRPVCPPKPPHVKPPGTGDHGHNGHRPPPPFVAHPVPPVVHDAPRTPAAAALPRTGGTPLPLAFAGGALILGGAGLRRLSKVGA